MALNPRQRKLLERVREDASVSIETLAQTLGVTPQTVRRDVRLLERDKLLSRYHGGVGLPSTVENIGYLQRQSLQAEPKRRIAEAVAARVPNDCSLLINIGTTTEAVARALLRHRGLHVVTNNLNVALILADNPHCEVIVSGGVVRCRDRGIVGEAASDFIANFRVDIGIIGISGIEEDGTLCDFDAREVKVAQTIIRQSREVWLVADRSKFGRHALVRLAHLDQIDVLFTDELPPEPMGQALADSAIEVIVAA
jgi:DeoR family glycerol-3-phosphate regulon repressor